MDRDFWPRLIARADELQLSRSLFYALRYLRYFLDTPVPDSVTATLDTAAPNRTTLTLMDSIFTRVLAPEHASCADAFTPTARLAAFVRAHWLRMPVASADSAPVSQGLHQPLSASPKSGLTPAATCV